MKSVLVRIQEYSAQASGAEKGVLRFLRENPEEAAGYSIKQLADKTFSSAATIVRLCRKMGFDGYKELQKSLLYESALRRESTRPMEQEIKKDDSLEELVNKVTYKNIVSLDNTWISSINVWSCWTGARPCICSELVLPCWWPGTCI